MNTYEIGVLIHPDLEIDIAKPLKKVEKIFTDNGGIITKTDNQGKKKMAYSIAKQEHAVYVFYTLDLPGESVAKIESTLNITDEVMRYLIVRVDLKAIAKAEAAKADKAKKAASRGEKLDEETGEE